MSNKRPWRDEAGELLESINSNFKAAQKQHLLTIAQHALAWLAELTEKGEA